MRHAIDTGVTWRYAHVPDIQNYIDGPVSAYELSGDSPSSIFPEALQAPSGAFPYSATIVCYAFVAKVSLKLLPSLQGKTFRGHDLAQLFRSLSAAIKADLRARTQWPKADFFKELGRIATAFVEWCYVFESAGRALNFLFLKDFATAAELEACPLPPPRVATDTLK